MAKVKAFESNSIYELEDKLNHWLRDELSTHNNKINIKLISHCYTNHTENQKLNALIVYEYA